MLKTEDRVKVINCIGRKYALEGEAIICKVLSQDDCTAVVRFPNSDFPTAQYRRFIDPVAQIAPNINAYITELNNSQ